MEKVSESACSSRGGQGDREYAQRQEEAVGIFGTLRTGLQSLLTTYGGWVSCVLRRGMYGP